MSRYAAKPGPETRWLSVMPPTTTDFNFDSMGICAVVHWPKRGRVVIGPHRLNSLTTEEIMDVTLVSGPQPLSR